jgi:hypothetical protein
MAMAVLHTFFAGFIRKFSHHFGKNSLGEISLHLLSEVEVIFAVWALIFLVIFALMRGPSDVLAYLGRLHFGEAVFVFTIMTILSARPILWLAEILIVGLVRVLPGSKNIWFYVLCLTLGPVLGSFITEPAAMTVSALLLLKGFFSQKVSMRFKYFTLGVLFVNISIGGTLTHYAAPPVLMVAQAWSWSTAFMFWNFGVKALVAIGLNAALAVALFRHEFKNLVAPAQPEKMNLTKWLTRMLTLDGAKLKEAALVAMFLSGLVILGGLQRWWLEPVLARFHGAPLFLGSMGLTAIVDNAALTYLASTVTDISDLTKYLIVAGAVAGGGLTVIANAPNPAGNAILSPAFGEDGISAGSLLLGALAPTVIAGSLFWFF